MNSSLNRRNLIIGIVAVALAFALGGCATSGMYTTRAYPTVSRPAPTSDNYAEWGSYYTDQFAVYGYKTEAPPAGGPEAQKKAYNDAKLNWDQYMSTVTKAEKNQTNMWLIYGAASVGATIILLLMI